MSLAWEFTVYAFAFVGLAVTAVAALIVAFVILYVRPE